MNLEATQFSLAVSPYLTIPRVDLTLVMSSGMVKFIDNNSDQKFLSTETAYRVTDFFHVDESQNHTGFSLANQVHEVLPNMIVPTSESVENFSATAEIITSSGSQIFEYSCTKLNKYTYTLIGNIGNVSIPVEMPIALLKPNKNFKKRADFSRAIYLLLFKCLGISVHTGKGEEKAFKKFIKRLQKSYVERKDKRNT